MNDDEFALAFYRSPLHASGDENGRQRESKSSHGPRRNRAGSLGGGGSDVAFERGHIRYEDIFDGERGSMQAMFDREQDLKQRVEALRSRWGGELEITRS